MRRPTHNAVKLPRQLLEELGVADGNVVGRNKRAGPPVRKQRRRVARVQKKSRNLPSKSTSLRRASVKQPVARDDRDSDSDEALPDVVERKSSAVAQQLKHPKSILKIPMPSSENKAKVGTPSPQSLSTPPPVRVSQGTKDRLAADDEEIAALERALGLRSKKTLPKAFEEDGLADLIDGLGSAGGPEDGPLGKRKRGDDLNWLESKRQKASEKSQKITNNTGESASSMDVSNSEAEDPSNSDLDDGGTLVNEEEIVSSEELDADLLSAHNPGARIRENPYVAPVTSVSAGPTKYIPPSLRDTAVSRSDDLLHLRRKIQGLLNRLSEANFASVLGDLEKIYRDYPRQHVSSTLLDLLLGLLCDPTSLQDTFIILHAGFLAAIHKVTGTYFGAQAIERIDEEFVKHYKFDARGDSTGKRTINLMSLISELYNFQVVGSSLMYDFIQLFLKDLTEINAELLLKIMRSSGLQLRQDDSSSLRNIVVLLQQAIERVGEKNLSVRTKFMVETIHNIKNNRNKNGSTSSAVTSEHTIRMKKTLGTLNTRTIKGIEPLRIGLKDIRNSDKRGKWWLVGASYKDESQSSLPVPVTRNAREGMITDGATADLVNLAREHRMNTDVRRSIFVAIMSATDYNDAYLRLHKLGLKKKQEEEIPKVLIHCSGAENSYNPFYTLLARRVCSDRKLKMGFQLSLWDLFRRMGEGQDSKEDENSDQEDALGLRYLVNLAKMFGTLVVEGGLGLGILKTINLVYLQAKTRTFLELMFVTIFLQFSGDPNNRKAEASLTEIFLSPKEIAALAGDLQYFLKKVVSKTDLAGSKGEEEIIKWGCRVAGDALKAVAFARTADN